MMAETNFWDDQEAAQKVLQENKIMGRKLETWKRLLAQHVYFEAMVDLLGEADDASLLPEAGQLANALEQLLGEVEFQQMLSGENDRCNAILSLNAGAGGTEAQDWANMLLRMYVRWGERHHYKTQIVDILTDVEAGIKNATVTIQGEYAFGYLQSEVGVHRLVRISPFDANKRRHTSFASVMVIPEIEEDVNVEIDETDLRIDTYRSSGAGGQHVNTTDSAVRITHLPTNIVVQCQNERSQHKNRAQAMKILRSRLYEVYQAEQDERMEKLQGEKRVIAWGSQIRSYVLHPYQMIKDHRTNDETSNVTAVLDGDLDNFMRGFLLAGKPQ